MNYSASYMQRFIQSGGMAIIRIDSPKDVVPTVEALVKGGVEWPEQPAWPIPDLLPQDHSKKSNTLPRAGWKERVYRENHDG